MIVDRSSFAGVAFRVAGGLDLLLYSLGKSNASSSLGAALPMTLMSVNIVEPARS